MSIEQVGGGDVEVAPMDDASFYLAVLMHKHGIKADLLTEDDAIAMVKDTRARNQVMFMSYGERGVSVGFADREVMPGPGDSLN